jgi:hypothetical protein
MHQRSLRVYFLLVVLLAFLAAISVFLPQGDFLPVGELPASKPILALANAGIAVVLYGGLGLVGMRLVPVLGFAELWDDNVTDLQRFLLPALLGFGIGVFFIVADAAFSRFHDLGVLPHPPFPTSLVASLSAGIGEELIFRLFFVSFWVWLISKVALRGRHLEPVFWVVTLVSAVAFALGHLPAGMMILGLETVSDIPAALLAEVLVLNGVLSVFAAYYLRRFGFLAAVGLHFWTDIVWHVAWGLVR